MQAYESSLASQPLAPEVLVNLGNALRTLDRPAEAETRFRDAIAQRPHWIAANKGLGRSLLEQGRHREGLASLRAAQGVIEFGRAEQPVRILGA